VALGDPGALLPFRPAAKTLLVGCGALQEARLPRAGLGPQTVESGPNLPLLLLVIDDDDRGRIGEPPTRYLLRRVGRDVQPTDDLVVSQHSRGVPIHRSGPRY
jgi:hypothetical protein